MPELYQEPFYNSKLSKSLSKIHGYFLLCRQLFIKMPISKWKLCLTLIKGGARALSRAFLLRSASICRCRSILASFSRCRLSRSQVCNDHKSVCVHNGVEFFLNSYTLYTFSPHIKVSTNTNSQLRGF